MTYTILRDGEQYGPYTLADLQHYVSSGEVALTDMVTSEGLSEPVPVSQVVGTIAVPVAVAASAMPAVEYPNPPNLHWGLVLLFTCLSWGLFMPVWGIVLSSWLKKVMPSSKALFYYIAEVSCWGLVFFFSMLVGFIHAFAGLAYIVRLAGVVISLVARYSFRASMEEHYNNAEGIPLSLSGVMTFFFSTIYFQYHVNDIVRRKKAVELEFVERRSDAITTNS